MCVADASASFVVEFSIDRPKFADDLALEPFDDFSPKDALALDEWCGKWLKPASSAPATGVHRRNAGACAAGACAALVTALVTSRYDVKEPIVSALLAAYPDAAEIPDTAGSTPLAHAKAKHAAHAVQALLSRGVDRRTLYMYADFDHDALGAVIADDFLARGCGALRYAISLVPS